MSNTSALQRALFGAGLVALATSSAAAQDRPNKGNWQLAEKFSPANLRSRVFTNSVNPHWLGQSDSLCYDWKDHNGSTFYQHEKFLAVVRGTGTVEVTLTDGINAALIGLAAEHSAATGTMVDLAAGPYRLARG